MSIFLATSRGKYSWKQTPGQSVLIFGKIIGTHCDRRDAWNNTASRNRDMFWQTAIPTGTNAFQTTQRVCCRLPGSDDNKGLQLPLLCMERAGALQPLPPFLCLWIRYPLSGHSLFWYPLFPIPFHPHFQTFHATWWHVTTTYWKSAYYSNLPSTFEA